MFRVAAVLFLKFLRGAIDHLYFHVLGARGFEFSEGGYLCCLALAQLFSCCGQFIAQRSDLIGKGDVRTNGDS